VFARSWYRHADIVSACSGVGLRTLRPPVPGIEMRTLRLPRTHSNSSNRR
jgi:hypothetical protein